MLGQPPATDYWFDIIPAVKSVYPDFCFIAEAYWDLEWELQQQGFDFCYDKRLYDRRGTWRCRLVFGCISVPTWPTRKSCFASWKTTMSRGRRPCFRGLKRRPLR